MEERRELNIANGFNFRDIGGYRNDQGMAIKWHKLVRAAYLSDLSVHDQQALYDYGIRTIIDLRSDAEVKKYPDRYLQTIDYLRVPILNEDLTNSMTKIANLSRNAKFKHGLRMMLKVYDMLITQVQAQHAYRAIFNLLAKSNGGILVHCATGKDRTGVVIILLLKMLGISDAVIRSDYLLTNRFSALHINRRLNEAKDDGADSKMLKTVFNLSTVNGQYYDEVASIVSNTYGSFSNYIYNQLQVSRSTVETLRKNFMEKAPLR